MQRHAETIKNEIERGVSRLKRPDLSHHWHFLNAASRITSGISKIYSFIFQRHRFFFFPPIFMDNKFIIEKKNKHRMFVKIE